MTESKKASWKKGLWAEYLCMWILRLKGHHILAHRYKTKVGEIDIVARKGNTLLFIEIKARPTLETGLTCITGKQRQRIQHAAEIFLSRNRKKDFNQIRFDVMVAVPWQFPYHLKDAWRI